MGKTKGAFLPPLPCRPDMGASAKIALSLEVLILDGEVHEPPWQPDKFQQVRESSQRQLWPLRWVLKDE